MKEIAIKQRFYPTKDQAELFAKTFGCVRVVWNNILKARTDSYYQDGKSISYNKASAMLTSLKKIPEYDWLGEVASVALQQSIRNQQSAFKNFFDKRGKYPKFKSKKNKQSFSLVGTALKYENGKLFIAKSKEPLNIRWSRELPSNPSSITISKDTAGRYFVSMLCKFKPKPMPVTAKTIGIDLGLTDLFITSDGEKQSNPRHTKRYESKLAFLQRKLFKKKKGSANRAKAKHKVAKLHAKIADCRLDNLHKLSRKLINDNQVVCVETLAVKNMIKNPKLAKHIADASWGEFVRQLSYKAEWADRTISKIDRFFPSSKRCSTEKCGFINQSLKLSVRSWECPQCHTTHDRDINAAINILTVGMAGLA
ncbi:transposase [Psychromonas marina]|uniref:Transposase n=1 Tax=Psychromonas marina TaxID=88364 RepID=A0ABQ6DV64_9GAMM|nr:RNA-guided endonuclease TnpB family protein [Psychromonas marina]GLS88987.1 transposase [Psychromonas marina]